MLNTLYTPDCIRTYTGRFVNVFQPTPEMICIEDIAHSLSNQCRFGGHLAQFYSVAQHSINCAGLVSSAHTKAALLHDSSEAYLMDIPSPIKAKMPEYKKIELGCNGKQIYWSAKALQVNNGLINSDVIWLVKTFGQWQNSVYFVKSIFFEHQHP